MAFLHHSLILVQSGKTGRLNGIPNLPIPVAAKEFMIAFAAGIKVM
jgi:hypothetical protein